jgi:D-lactate dehydrogenase
MKLALFSCKPYDRKYFELANQGHHHELLFFEEPLSERTALSVPKGAAVCGFVNDNLDRGTLSELKGRGVPLVAQRCAGFNNVDLEAAAELHITIARVPAYSPYAVAEHAVALLLCLDRKLHKAYARVREGNYSLGGLVGFDLNGRTIGVVGTGTIGRVFARIMQGFGCRVLAFDPAPDEEVKKSGVEYVALEGLLAESDVISLHCPLMPVTHHMIDAVAIARMKAGVTLINTSRGALVDTSALIKGLKSRHIGGVALDVYEEEASVFFEDHSEDIIADDLLMRLISFPNVLLTSHQGFLTAEALGNIASVTLSNVTTFETGVGTLHRVAAEGKKSVTKLQPTRTHR